MLFFFFNLDIWWDFFASFLPRSKSCHPHTPCSALGGLFGRVLVTCEFSTVLCFWGVWLIGGSAFSLFCPNGSFPRTYWTLTRRVMSRDCGRHVTRGCWGGRGEVWRCIYVFVCMYVCLYVCIYIVLYWIMGIVTSLRWPRSSVSCPCLQ